MLVTLIIFLITLSVLIIVHELGHFFAAKIIGVTAEKFAIGFPPKLWSKKFGETEFKINALPIGGYVSLKGEEGDEKVGSTDKTSLLSKSPLEHLFVFISGVIMNYFLGVLLLWIVFMVGTQPIMPNMPEYKGLKNTQKVVIEDVEKNTPAESQGLKSKDIIISIDGKDVTNDKEVLNIIQSKVGDDGAKVDIVIERDGQKLEKNVSTYKSKVQSTGNKEIEINRIGIILTTTGKVQAPFFVALKVAILESFRIIGLTFSGLINLFAILLTKFQLSSEVSGPVGTFVATSYFMKLGLTSFLQFAAIISLSLAVFNILPIPALDGGQIFFTMLEVLFRRKFSMKAKAIIQMIGFGLLISLMIAVTIKDISTFTSLFNIFKR